MAQAKTQAFDIRRTQLARIAKALSHPARVSILEFLLQTDSCICGDIVDVLPLSQSTVSQHLKELKDAGLIQGEIDGPRVCYCIRKEAWLDAKEAFSQFFAQEKDNLIPGTCC